MTQGNIQKSIPNAEDLKKIETFTRRAMTEDELYVFNVSLCNNDVDRDFEKFSVSSLKKMAKLFLGKTGIFDHSMKAGDQKARIFDTFVEKIDGRTTQDGEDYYALKAKAYMLNNSENQSLINEIDAGIKKEVSVSCSVENAYCSICKTDKRKHRCEHISGKEYNNKLCFTILDNPTDAYEFSFVAVPAQREAGVTKSFEIKEDYSVQDIVKNLKDNGETILSKSQSNQLLDYISELEQEAYLGKEYKKQLAKEVVELFKNAFPNMDTELFGSITSVMTTKELLGFCKGMKESKSKSNLKPQLAIKPEQNKIKYSEFHI